MALLTRTASTTFKALLFAVLIFFYAASAFALACTSNAAGSWGTAGTWASCGGGTPANGDTATIGHAVTVDSSVTIGTSPAAGTMAITVNSGGGALTVSSGVTLTVRGDINLNNAALTLSSGSVLEFDASAAASPSTTTYEMRISTAHNQASARLNINGTSGSRVTIRSNSGGANGFISDGSGPWLQGGLITGSYVDFLRVGDASNSAIRFSPTSSATFSLTNATFTSGGRLSGTYNWGATCNVTLQNITMVSTQHATDSLNVANASGYTSGTRLIDGNVFDKQVHFYTGAGLIVTNNYFAQTVDSTAGDWTSASGNIFEDQNNLLPGGLSDSYMIDPDATDNPHYLQPNAQSGPTYTGLIFECPNCTNSTDAGDGISMNSPASVMTYTITRSIVLPSSTGRTSGVLVSALGNGNVRLSLSHNTWWLTANDASGSNSPALLTVGETFNTATGQVTLFKSNIAAASASRNAYLLRNVNGAPNNDVCSSTDCDYNAMHNLLAGSEGKGYNLPVTGSPGANDVSANPQFFDPTRNMATFDLAYCGGGGTTAHAISTLKLKNTPSEVAACNITNLLSHVRDGFRPTNVLYRDVGHDGQDLGAVDGVYGTGGRNILLLGVG